MIKVTRKSMFTGVERTIELPIKKDVLERWEKGEGLVQNVFPGLTPDQREFLMTGATAEEWEAAKKNFHSYFLNIKKHQRNRCREKADFNGGEEDKS